MAVAKTTDGVQVTTSTAAGRTEKDMVTSRVEFEKSENGGFIAKQYLRPKEEKAKKGDSCCGPFWFEPKTFTFTTPDECAAFLARAFGAKK